MRELQNYIGITGLSCVVYKPSHISEQQMLSSFKAVLFQYFVRDNGDNYHYEYEIKSANGSNSLELASWRITRIYTGSHFSPKYIQFEITDPAGMTDREAKILRKAKDGTEYFIGFKSIGIESLNNGLRLLNELSKYKSWLDFIVNSGNHEYSNEVYYEYGKVTQDNKKLKEENRQLKGKLDQIAGILA